MICDCGQQSSADVPRFPWHCACGAVWQDESTRTDQSCIYLGELTGDVVACRSCSNRGKAGMPIYRCAIHGVCVMHKPVVMAGREPWDGEICLTCDFKMSPIGDKK